MSMMGMGPRRSGLGGFMQDAGERIDNILISQAREREAAIRADAIAEIKQGYMNAADQPGTQDALRAAGINPTKYRQRDPGKYEADYQAAAEMQRGVVGEKGGPGWASLEAVNNAMATNPYARYGVIGSAAVGGGAAMTAGAQKLAQVMGLLEEAQNVEEARDMPLHS